ncbi:galectin-8-like [Synchiropus splendidus]|uniref:galectin-8-like n=1 Tax=Synchiropus splendidus TaxID=270530 RepID=UPI00237E2194|nr:galectin-8-like [Synchiropus splendidus]
MSMVNPKQTISNPVIPFSWTVLGGFQPGEMVLVQGSVPPSADRFQVDFLCGSSVKPRADVAFHFNPRFGWLSQCIVCNSLQGERWGHEEILHHMPFKPGGAFELAILVQKDTYKVAVNGTHLLEYRHRLGLERVDTLAISGKVNVDAIAVLPSLTGSEPPGPGSGPGSQPSNTLAPPCGDWKVPFRAELPDGLSAGRSITIRGRTTDGAQSVCVNLRVSGSSDIALHLNPRLDRRLFVRNSFLSECWGSEETQLDAFPFRAGHYFEMIVLCEQQRFRVAVNGSHQFCYKHRVQDLSRVTLLEITQDLTLEEVRLQ